MMGTIGDAYAVLLHDDRLRAGLIASDASAPRRRRTAGRGRAALAAGLRALASRVDAPPAPVAAGRAPAPAR